MVPGAMPFVGVLPRRLRVVVSLAQQQSVHWARFPVSWPPMAFRAPDLAASFFQYRRGMSLEHPVVAGRWILERPVLPPLPRRGFASAIRLSSGILVNSVDGSAFQHRLAGDVASGTLNM